jgi:hypothetical protein
MLMAPSAARSCIGLEPCVALRQLARRIPHDWIGASTYVPPTEKKKRDIYFRCSSLPPTPIFSRVYLAKLRLCLPGPEILVQRVVTYCLAIYLAALSLGTLSRKRGIEGTVDGPTIC